eukprot:6198874-Pleurochrysis_carterae.AAC.5
MVAAFSPHLDYLLRAVDTYAAEPLANGACVAAGNRIFASCSTTFASFEIVGGFLLDHPATICLGRVPPRPRRCARRVRLALTHHLRRDRRRHGAARGAAYKLAHQTGLAPSLLLFRKVGTG